VCLHLLGLLSVPLYGPLEFLPPQVHLSDHVGEGANSPTGEGFGQQVTFYEFEEVGEDAVRVGLEEALSGDLTDAAENFHS